MSCPSLVGAIYWVAVQPVAGDTEPQNAPHLSIVAEFFGRTYAWHALLAVNMLQRLTLPALVHIGH
jgi:hypothetical protein